MASGTITGSFSGGSGSSAHTIYIVWEQVEGTSGSTVYATLYAGQTKTWGSYKAGASYQLKIGSTVVDSGTINYDERDYTGRKIFEIASGSHYFSGTSARDIYISGSLDLSGTTAGSGSAGDLVTLDPIASYVTVYVSDWDNTSGSTIRSRWDSIQVEEGSVIYADDYWGTTPPSDDYEYVDSDICVASEGAVAWRNFKQKIKYVNVYVNDYCWDTSSYIRYKWDSKVYQEGESVDASDWGTDPPSAEYEFDSFDAPISAKEGATVERNFRLKKVNVNCDDYTTDGVYIGSAGSAKSYTYGASVSGSAWGTSTTVGAYHTGYKYSSSSSDTAYEGVTVYRYFTPAQYTVTCYDVIDSESGTKLGTNTAQKDYNTEVSGSDVSSATYTGYHYVSDTTITVGTSGNVVYRIFNANEYYLSYDVSPGHEETPLPTTATYDQWLQIPDPVRLGYELEGWDISDMSNNTHYYSADGSTKHSFSGGSAENVYGPYFMNLTSDENGTVYLKARWKAKGLGRIYIPDDNKYHSALCFIYHNGKYYQCIPYIYSNGKYRIGG